MIQELGKQEIEEVLKKQTVGRIGCYSDGEVYVVPVSYAYDGSYFYIHAFEGKKIDMLRKNPNLCFQVDQLINMADWKSVVTWGKFEEITNPVDRNKALQILLDRNLPVLSSNTTHLGDVWPFPTDKPETIGGIVFRIEISRKTGRFEKEAAVPYMAG